MLSRKYRFRGQKDLARVYRKGRSVRLGPFMMKSRPNNLGFSRLSVVVSKKVTKSAPRRNRIRRRVYEFFRVNWEQVPAGHDIIISVFAQEVASMPAPELQKMLNELLAKMELGKTRSS